MKKLNKLINNKKKEINDDILESINMWRVKIMEKRRALRQGKGYEIWIP